MKKITYIAFALILTLTGCTEDFDLEDRGFILTELPNYVAFNPPGTNATIAPVDATEGDTEAINVEVPGGTVSDVTVNYSFSGTAEFGVDFTVDGATASGGTLNIELTTTPDQTGQPINADISLVLLEDGVADGDKTLVITLESASNAEGALAVGRGGTDALRSLTVNIADADAPAP